MDYIQVVQQYYKDSKKYADPRTKDWFLLNDSPIYVILLSAVYIIFVKWLGSHWMRDRKPIQLREVLLLYNLFNVVLSLYMAIELVLSWIDAGYGILCAPYNKESQDPTNPKELRVAKVMWWYFFSKAIEYLDTVFMVLRKKTEQVTFLHVFHHVSMLNIMWWVTAFTPGGMSCFGAILNSGVHATMYLYYGLAAIPSLRPYLWWKKLITKMQMVQFVLIFSHTVNSIFSNCDFPSWGKYLQSGYLIVMFALFTNFYMHAYNGKRKPMANGKELNGNHFHSNGHSYTNGEPKLHENGKTK